MANQTWPATLPQEILVDGYKRPAIDVLLESPMDQGPPKVRRRMTANIRELPCAMMMTAAQFDIFEAYWEDDLLHGSLLFNFTDPKNGSTSIEVDMPTYEGVPMDDEIAEWRVDMLMRIWP